jgi:alpha-1,2-mannosyltransferase
MTIVLQFVGSCLLTIEAWLRQPVEFYIDTHGHPAGYPFVRLFLRVPVVCYTHYPVISTDMIQKVRQVGANSIRIGTVKVWYYYILLRLYGFMGRFITIAICNSSWTKGHLDYIWSTPTNVIFPPCNVDAFLELSAKRAPRKIAISIG